MRVLESGESGALSGYEQKSESGQLLNASDFSIFITFRDPQGQIAKTPITAHKKYSHVTGVTNQNTPC